MSGGQYGAMPQGGGMQGPQGGYRSPYGSAYGAGPYANSGLGRYGAMPSWQVPAYQPRMYQPPQLGPRPSWYAPPGAAGAAGGMSPPAYSSPGGEGTGGGVSAGPSNNQGPTPGINGPAVGLGLSAVLGPIGMAIGQAVNGMGATSGVANDADAAAAAAANGPGMGAVGVGPGVSGGEAASGNSQGEANDASGDNGSGGGGAGGK